MTRTLLFDVDQTLLYSGGAGGLAMSRAFHELYGIENGFQAIEASGRTDWAILKRGLETHGLLNGELSFDAALPAFMDAYLEHLPQTLREAEGGHIKPGVPELLEALGERAAQGDVRLGLATGNFKRSCLLKLEFYKLDAHLRDGGFGEDAEDRGEMVAKAIERMGGVTNGNGAASRLEAASATAREDNTIWIIGDTPRDVQAAAANGARCLAVATGASSVDELLAEGADVALADLADTQAVLDTLLD